MARGRAGGVGAGELRADCGEPERFGVGNGLGKGRHGIGLRAVHGARRRTQDFCNAAHVVRMVVGGEDGGQREPLGGEVIENGLRLARLDDSRLSRIAQSTDIIALERLRLHNVPRLPLHLVYRAPLGSLVCS